MRRLLAPLTAAALACSSGGSSPPPPPPLPTAPILQAVAGVETVTLSWTDPNDPPATRYDLYWSDAGAVTLASGVLAGVTSPYVHGPLRRGRTYRYAIVAVAAGGTSPLSAEATAALPWTGLLSQAVASPGITTFGQSIPAQVGDGEHFPGQSGYWDLDADFSVRSGGVDGPFDGAQILHVGRLATSPPSLGTLVSELSALDVFPLDQEYAELTYRTPAFGAADGVALAALSDGSTMEVPPISGTRSAFLGPTSDSRLQQPLDLRGVAAATVSWKQAIWNFGGLVSGAPASFGVGLRQPDGTPIEGLVQGCERVGTSLVELCSTDVNVGLGQEVVLSFELSAMAPVVAQIDDVAVTGGAVLVNGDFESADGWTTNAGAESQNVTSGSRTLCVDGPAASPCAAPLVVTRSFFTAPTSRWARIVDVFENPGSAPVTADVVYATVSAAYDPITYDPGGWGNAVSGVDASVFPAPVRDFSLVVGDAETHHGYGLVFAVRPIVVPAGGRVALASFLLTDPTHGSRDGHGFAAGVDPVAVQIADGFASTSDSTYRDWLTQEQLDAIVNF